ncbi:MAG TPA: TIGR03087 family PEP-CTERM/XrtA system glycosyltransferase [Steroidobacteraceae bacterium]|nr:TIGR03087 family PEP-CTERM/XrtA system glycosyltransferase [Steroidobacteraceae bacterium]
MNVLFVCHRVPYPPKRGGKIRPFNIIRHLHEQGHRVTVASLARSAAELAESRDLGKHCAEVLVEVIPARVAFAQMVARLPTPAPSSFGYFWSRRLAQRIAAAADATRFDLVFVHCSSVAGYVERVKAPLRIMDFGDMDSQKWREYAGHRAFPLSAGFWLEAVKLERRELRIAAQFDLSTCTTRAELESLRTLGVNTPSDWFPNGVDAGFFAPDETPYEPDLIAFVGRMDYYPNQQGVTGFCRDILPALRARRPGVRFAIVGADPPESIRALAREPGVTVTGSVPDVRPHVRRAALTVAPLAIARGTQNKILESMAMGVPVVCSREASGGVDAVAGEHLLVASNPSQWIDAIEGILGDRAIRQRLSAAGRDRVLSHHSWVASMTRLDGIMEKAGR